jgi:hypothetical protein
MNLSSDVMRWISKLVLDDERWFFGDDFYLMNSSIGSSVFVLRTSKRIEKLWVEPMRQLEQTNQSFLVCDPNEDFLAYEIISKKRKYGDMLRVDWSEGEYKYDLVTLSQNRVIYLYRHSHVRHLHLNVGDCLRGFLGLGDKLDEKWCYSTANPFDPSDLSDLIGLFGQLRDWTHYRSHYSGPDLHLDDPEGSLSPEFDSRLPTTFPMTLYEKIARTENSYSKWIGREPIIPLSSS